MPSSQPAPVRPRRPSRWLIRAGVVLAALVCVVGLLPRLVSWAGLVGPIASAFLSDTELHVDRASLGWLSPIRMAGVRLETESGELSMSAKEISTQRTLWDLLRSWRRVGTVRIAGVTVVAKSVEAPANPDPQRPGKMAPIGSMLSGLEVELEVVDGSLTVVDAISGRSRTLRDVRAILAVPGPSSSDLHCELAGELDATNPSRIELTGNVAFDRSSGDVAMIEGKAASTGFPLELANVPLAYLGSDVRVSGWLTCDAAVSWKFATGEGVIQGKANVEKFSCRSGLMTPDRLELVRVDGRADLRISRERIEIQEGSIECDLGVARGRGCLDWNAPAGSVPSLQVDATVDLAELSRQLPRTMGLRSDVEVTSGQIIVSIRPAADDRVDASAEVRNLAAVCQGETITWSSPVSMDGRVGLHDTDGVVFDRFQCESDVLRAQGSGSLSNFDVTAVCDLGRIQERLGRLLDLSGLSFAGRATARLQSQRGEDGTVRIRGAARTESLDIRDDGKVLIAEENLDAQLTLIALTSEATSIQSCLVSVQAKEDKASFELTGSIGDWRQSWGAWIVEGEGDLARFLRRAEPWIGTFTGWTFAGATTFSGRLVFEESATTIEAVHVLVRDLSAAAEGVRVADPNVQIAGSIQWNSDASFVVVAKTALSSGQVQWNELRGRWAEDGLEVQANGVMDLDLARIRSWTVDTIEQVDVGGRMTGPFTLHASKGRWTSQINGRIAHARYGVGREPLIAEPNLEFAGTVVVDMARDLAILFDPLRLSLPGVALVGQGSIRDLSGAQELALEGVCEYDLALLTPRLQTLLGQGVSFAGRDRRAFKLSGQLTVPHEGLAFASAPETSSAGQFPLLGGEASFGWQSANLFGFVAGPAVADGVLRESWLSTKPIHFTLSGGKAVLQPRIYFGTDATYLMHPAGVLADHVRVTREMCDASLQYIAPALAKSVDVAGSVSLKAGQVKIPLGALDKADFSGRLHIHQVKATGGPMVRELIFLTEGQPILDIANESEVPFRVFNGRVYHENLTIRLPGMVVKTSGSVGFDHSMALVVETPIPKRWLGTPAIAKQMEGKTIKVPIGGTLDQPRLDRKALQTEIARLVQKGAGGVIENKINQEIDKQLDKLFDRLK